MRRFIAFLLLFPVLFILIMLFLITCVDPQHLRNEMLKKIEVKTGYKIAIKGEMRWHLWPQPSILTDRVTFTAPGQQHPFASAENMRLDVALFPLFSRKISVEEVLLKNAIVYFFPDASTPSSHQLTASDKLFSLLTQGWNFDISSLKIKDSLVIWRQKNGEEINFRNLNVLIKRKDSQHANIFLETHIYRNQRQLSLSLNSIINTEVLPSKLLSQIENIRWKYYSPYLSKDGLEGEGNFVINWDRISQKLHINPLNISVNHQPLTGMINAKLTKKPEWQIALAAAKLNLDPLLAIKKENNSPEKNIPSEAINTPVISNTVLANPKDFFSGLNASLNLKLDELHWRGLILQDVFLNTKNQNTKIIFNSQARDGNGFLYLPGNIHFFSNEMQVTLQPQLKNVSLIPLLTAFSLPPVIKGNINFEGQFITHGLNLASFEKKSSGKAHLSINDAQIMRLNLPNMIERVVTYHSDQVKSKDFSNITPIQLLSANALLENGIINFTKIQGVSPNISLNGKGHLDLKKQSTDLMLNLKILGGFIGKKPIIDILQKTSIPLRLYGNWDNLNYDLQVIPLLKKLFQKEAGALLQELPQE